MLVSNVNVLLIANISIGDGWMEGQIECHWFLSLNFPTLIRVSLNVSALMRSCDHTGSLAALITPFIQCAAAAQCGFVLLQLCMPFASPRTAAAPPALYPNLSLKGWSGFLSNEASWWCFYSPLQCTHHSSVAAVVIMGPSSYSFFFNSTIILF